MKKLLLTTAAVLSLGFTVGAVAGTRIAGPGQLVASAENNEQTNPNLHPQFARAENREQQTNPSLHPQFAAAENREQQTNPNLHPQFA